jgi:uncharacterized RDD family membrane protein YckC
MADQLITVQSVTGVDLTLNIAGPGTRSYAFIIDWHIRLLLALVWLLIAVYAFHFSLDVKSAAALISLLPALMIYFLYHPVVELAMRGRTPGKRMAGVRVLNRNGGQPSTGALLIRNIFRLIDSLPSLYVLGLACCILTENRVRIGDLAAGTLLVIDNAAAEESLARVETLAANSQLPLETLELVDQILERWDALESQHRMNIARSLLVQVAPGTDAGALAGLDDLQLKTRLRALLNA